MAFAVRCHGNKYLWAIRRAFFRVMPLLLAVSFLDVLESLVLDPWSPIMGEGGANLGFWLTGGLSGDEYRQSAWVQSMISARRIISIGYGMLSMALAMSLSGNLAGIWGVDRVMAAFCTLAAFLFFLPQTVEVQGEFVDYFAARRFFSAFLTAFLATWIFSRLSHMERFRIPVPDFLPKDHARYFMPVLSVALTLLFLMILSVGFEELRAAIQAWVMQIPAGFFQHPVTVALYQAAVWGLWWFGIPGYGVASLVQQAIYVPLDFSNQLGDTACVFTGGFFEAMSMHVQGLAIAILVFSRHESWRSVSKFSLPALLFNIYEPVMFCLPVVLNPLFLIPFLMAPLANVLLGWVAVSWGIVPIFKAGFSWNMPLLLSGALGTSSFMGGILQVVCLVMDIFIYAPFVITANMLEFRGEEPEEGEEG